MNKTKTLNKTLNKTLTRDEIIQDYLKITGSKRKTHKVLNFQDTSGITPSEDSKIFRSSEDNSVIKIQANESIFSTTKDTADVNLMENVLKLKGVINKLKQENKELKSEKNDYEKLTIQQSKIMKDMGEEIIILRNQLDKFLNYKK
jgi:hypothetical protein